ncbi:MAG TPA: SdpI family protein [Candidatus Anaerostipes avistercoris]|uniref:SdpI family protein n=1 Tax=Candidatus Anaerostipes avistercoris TaxID=2838462 RepID=A0A9D2PI47_9FIRM|nr:SdpI family protein [Candidatus Anaerostipes avistercoris]
MIKMIRNNKLCFIIFLFSILLAAAVFPFLEDNIPIHWDINGRIDGYGSRYWIFAEPLMMLFLTILLDVTRKIDPRRDNYKKFEKNFGGIKAAVCLLLLLVQLITTAVCLGIDIQVQIVLPVLVGILFIYLGNMMPKFKHNYFVGIKTPWTLADPDVWFQTHRFSGKIWCGGGFFIILSAFLPSPLSFAVLLAAILILCFVPLIYSYYIYRKGKDS